MRKLTERESVTALKTWPSRQHCSPAPFANAIKDFLHKFQEPSRVAHNSRSGHLPINDVDVAKIATASSKNPEKSLKVFSARLEGQVSTANDI